MMDFHKVEFVLSVHSSQQLPESDLPEIAFAGRSNVGKSSLMNTLLGRRAMVKVSSRPGKTQGLNFFLVNDSLHLVDLPGYGFARVSKEMQNSWQGLITSYLETRAQLKCVVVILDIRHEPKPADTQLLSWLSQNGIPFLPVYTKLDKISGNERGRNVRALDAGHGIKPEERILFSAKTGQGRDELIGALSRFL